MHFVPIFILLVHFSFWPSDLIKVAVALFSLASQRKVTFLPPDLDLMASRNGELRLA